MRMILKLIALTLAVAGLVLGAVTAFAQAVPDPVGDWHGVLQTPRGPLTIVVTVSRNTDGSLKGELESPDQAPGQKIPATAISLENGQLAISVTPLSASFKGSWVAAEQAWNGIFTQGGDLPLKLTKGLPPSKPVIAGMDGVWNGKITLNGAELRLVLRVRTTAQGTAVALDSPDQLANGIPVQDLQRDGKTVRFSLPFGGQRYEGTLSDDEKTIGGTWTVPGQTGVPVSFVRAATADRTPPKRPQMPVAPFPYTAEEVAFDNPAATGVRLAGTLTIPPGKGPFPAAIMITGSGQQDRDETLMGHKPFWVIADYLSRRGIAVLRVDDRGVGKSTGDASKATSADFATDSNAAFAFLKTRKDIQPKAIGFIGHSEGGMIGPIAMASNKEVAFLVMMAGPGTALDQLLLSQRRLIGTTQGMSEADLNRAEPIMARLFKAMASGTTYDDGLAAAKAVLTPEAMAALGAPAGTNPQLILAQVGNPWFRYFLQYDPAPNLRAIKVPVLALNGSLDRQVPPKENLAAIKAALKDNKDVTIVELPGLNHLFQTAKTGGVGEYDRIEETVAPVALEQMASWINARFGRK
ncbi:MAG TPA: alpha/beta fold hydrolase [Sphingobium sp.]